MPHFTPLFWLELKYVVSLLFARDHFRVSLFPLRDANIPVSPSHLHLIN